MDLLAVLLLRGVQTGAPAPAVPDTKKKPEPVKKAPAPAGKGAPAKAEPAVAAPTEAGLQQSTVDVYATAALSLLADLSADGMCGAPLLLLLLLGIAGAHPSCLVGVSISACVCRIAQCAWRCRWCTTP